MQTFENEQRYDQSAGVVLAKYTDPAFLQKKYTALGRQDIQILEHRMEAARARLRVTYSDKPDMEVPDFARKLVPARAHVVQTVDWDLNRKSGRIALESKGSPVTVQGEMQLRDADGGCVNTISWRVSCSIPLIGGKIEKLLVEGLRKKAQLDEQVTRKLLAE